MTPKRHHARRSFFLFENGAPTGFDLWSPDVADPFHNLPTRSSAASSAPTVTKEIVQSARRSEEHTSELQSLMRISYAVFCLKKKKKTKKPHKQKTKNTN